MTTLVERGGRFVRDFVAMFKVTRDTAPIDTTAQMRRFASSRASFVAQKKLFGYLKTRMGTRYPSMFEDPAFVGSINIAKVNVFAACLSDLTVHVVAKACAGSGLAGDIRAAAAMRCFVEGSTELAATEVSAEEIAQWRGKFAARIENVHWENAALGHDAFSTSPKALLRWAPIADELKRYDAEIVRNSVKFAWNEVIRDYRARAVPERLAEAIAAEENAKG